MTDQKKRRVRRGRLEFALLSAHTDQAHAINEATIKWNAFLVVAGPSSDFELGDVTGWSNNREGEVRALIWHRTGLTTDIGTLGGDSAIGWSINDTLHVAGWAYPTPFATYPQAMVWDPTNEMSNPDPNDTNRSISNDINNAGVVVGNIRPGSHKIGFHVGC